MKKNPKGELLLEVQTLEGLKFQRQSLGEITSSKETKQYIVEKEA